MGSYAVYIKNNVAKPTKIQRLDYFKIKPMTLRFGGAFGHANREPLSYIRAYVEYYIIEVYSRPLS